MGALNVVRRYFPEVRAVEDAKKNIKIEVTKADEKSAKRRVHQTCAMAVATKRCTEATGVVVSLTAAYLVFEDIAYRYLLPESVSREVVAFDRDTFFAPGTYQLLAPTKTKRLGQYVNSKKRTGKENPNSKRFRHATIGVRTVLGQ